MEIKLNNQETFNNVEMIETSALGKFIFIIDGQKQIVDFTDIRYISHETRSKKKGGKFTKVEVPTYIVDGEILNEYELRQLQLDIKNGIIEIPKYMTSSDGTEFRIKECGNFCHEDGFTTPKGLDTIYKMAKNLLF